MFNGLWSNGAPLTPASIKEANDQLQAMNIRISELEQRIREQAELMDRREKEFNMRYHHLKCEKEAEAERWKQEIHQTQQKALRNEELLKEKDVQIAFMLHRCSYLDEAASYAPLLDQLSQCLKQAFAAPAPRVHAVKPTTQHQQQPPAATKQPAPAQIRTRLPNDANRVAYMSADK